MILASAVLSQYTRVTDDDRRHLMPIAELAMQLQRPLKTIFYTDNSKYIKMKNEKVNKPKKDSRNE